MKQVPILVTCKNENCTEQGIQNTFRHCTRCFQYFCSQCCDLEEHIVKLLNSWVDNYWFCPICAKPALNAVFVEKDIEERCQIFLESMESRLLDVEMNTNVLNQSFTNLKISFESNESTLLQKHQKNIEILQKTNDIEIFLQDHQQNATPVGANETKVDNNINNENQESMVNQLKDWQSRLNNVIVYNIPESALQNGVDQKKNMIKNFRDKVANSCNFNFNDVDITAIYRLGKKLDDASKIRPLLIKFNNTSMKSKLMRNAYKLKYSSYAISVDRSPEERVMYKSLLNKKRDLENKETSGEWRFRIKGPPWNLKIVRTKNLQL